MEHRLRATDAAEKRIGRGGLSEMDVEPADFLPLISMYIRAQNARNQLRTKTDSKQRLPLAHGLGDQRPLPVEVR